jgi:hypothetical protein
MRAVLRIIGILVVTLALAVPARAETILVTSGLLDWTGGIGGGANVTLAGDGFTFSGRTGFGIFNPPDQCGVPECTLGSSVDLRALFTGMDLGGTATFEGRTFPAVGSLAANSSASAEWTGSLSIPTTFSGGLLTAPFLFTGDFAFEEDPTTSWRRVGLLGSGTARLMFTPYPGQPGAFSLSSLQYEFSSAPVPEPTSMLLIGSGLAGLTAVRRRRRGR